MNNYIEWISRAERKTHDLFNLLSKLEMYVDVKDDILDKALLIDRYSVNIKYPGNYTPVTPDEFEETFVEAEKIITWIKSLI